MKKILSFILMGTLILNICMLEDTTSKASDTVEIVYRRGSSVTAIGIPITETGFQKKSVATSAKEVDESLGEVMNSQMENYLAGSTINAAKVMTLSEFSNYFKLKTGSGFSDEQLDAMGEDGTKSVVSFSLENEKYRYCGEDTTNTVMHYVTRAIGEYPSLASLETNIVYLYGTDMKGNSYLTELFVYSPIAGEEMAAKIADYKDVLAQLEKVPAEDATMTTAEKLLYLHDKIVTMGEYATGDAMNLAMSHVPLGIALNGSGVCQSYAAIFNQAAMDLGIPVFQILSTEHVWNAVQIGGKWYYIDTTFDDPVFSNPSSKPINYVNHKYFLFSKDSYPTDTDHEMDSLSEQMYGYILDSMGSDYEDFFPKKNGIVTQMSYEDGVWTYMENGVQKIWEGDDMLEPTPTPTSTPTAAPTPTSTATPTAVPTPTSTATPTAVPTQTSTATPTAAPTQTSTATPTAEPTQTSTATPTAAPTLIPTATPAGETGNTAGNNSLAQGSQQGSDNGDSAVSVAAPGKAVIQSLKNTKTRTIQCKLKKVKNAAGYQLRYATNKKMKNSKNKNVKGTTVTLKKLKKKKTYYIKVRAYRLVNGKKKYGKWSSVK
ncbi:MAG: hypothetical protein J5988_04780, partial [Eubacterium sp.]|nr:hypothetical protein [Eubacterium sp.]